MKELSFTCEYRTDFNDYKLTLKFNEDIAVMGVHKAVLDELSLYDFNEHLKSILTSLFHHIPGYNMPSLDELRGKS
jgi:hypothetical protein